MIDVIKRLSIENNLRLPDENIASIANDPNLREEVAICAYGYDLFSRMKRVAIGSAALVLWRTFAWLPSGSPKKKFKFSAELILNAEKAILERMISES